MGTIASQITSLTIVYSTVYSDADERKHQSPAQMASNAKNVSIWWRHHVPEILSTHAYPVGAQIIPAENFVNIMTFDGLAPLIANSSTAKLLTM